MRPPGVTVAPARPLPAAAVVLPIFVQGFYFVTSAAKVLGLVSSRDQKPVQISARVMSSAYGRSLRKAFAHDCQNASVDCSASSASFGSVQWPLN
jgi:hypothetical protein